jgi:hypothetical protein
MRGGDASAVDAAHPLLVAVPTDAYAELRKLGQWRKFLSVSGCYM